MNYFEIFGLEQQFAIDVNTLAQTYQNLQKTVHPDRFAHASSQEQLIAVKKSTLINDAYQTLKNPIQRGEYILNLRAVNRPSEQASYSDNSFLMRQMELHEMIAEVKTASDVEQAISAASKVLSSESAQLFSMMEQQLLENSETANLQACENLRKLKFYQKLHSDLDRIEESLLD